MKERYNIEISGIQLTIVSDETEDFVNSIVARIDERVNDLVVRNKRCSKLDAALLCALDYCGEAVKAEKRIRNLEAQISLYDANIKRMREELSASQNVSASVKSALGVADVKEESAGAPAADAPAGTQTVGTQTVGTQTAGTSPVEEVPAANAAVPEADAQPAVESAPAKKSKLEQIEMLLRNGND